MIRKTKEPTLSDIAKSLARLEATMVTKDELKKTVSGLATKDELKQAVSGLATKDELKQAVSGLATKDEFKESIDRLDATIRREAGDLGESIASLTDMVAKEFDSLTITRHKHMFRRIKNSPAKGC